MTGIRRAFVLASAERYGVLVINFAITIILARLLTPEEYGISIIGSAALTIAAGFCNLGISAYLVQQQDLTAKKIQTAFTVALCATIVVIGPIALFAGSVAELYGQPALKHYVQVMALSFALGPFISTMYALLRRQMAFGTLAVIGIVTSVVNAGATLALALLGFSYMSFAWAALASGVVGLLLYAYVRPDFSIFRPSFGEAGSILAFGAFESANSLLANLWENFPYLVLGRFVNAEAVGLYQRGWMVNRLPDRILLAGIFSVALPALAEQAREGRSLSTSYLQAVRYIAAVQWPALLILILLAHPVVLVLLGPQWLEVAPLVQIMAAAQLSAVTVSLNYPTLIAAGAIRHTLPLHLLQVGSSVIIVALAAMHGLYAVAFSLWFTVPFNVLLSVCLVRFHVGFRWRELAAALRQSAEVAVWSSVGPLLAVVVAGSPAAVSVTAAILGVMLAAVGWLAGLWRTDHPLLHEIDRVLEMLRNSAIGRKFLGTDR